MVKVAIIGSGSVGHTLAAILGARPELDVALWGRRWERAQSRELMCFGENGTYAIGVATVENDLGTAVRNADMIVLAVPTPARHDILGEIADRIANCALLLSWEGTGRFAQSLIDLKIHAVSAGLQRSPIICRIRQPGSSVELIGVRNSVVAAAVNPAHNARARVLLSALLPFHFVMAPEFEYVSVSPGNPLIHPARLFSSQCATPPRPACNDRFYADWDDGASKVLLALHKELAALRDAANLSRKFIRTLVDRRPTPSPSELTREIRDERRLSEVRLPCILDGEGTALDRSHRFFREDIGEGLSYIVELARNRGVAMPNCEAIVRWYDQGRMCEGRPC
ncbi:NAD/NADP octopine/nopaline dehydrogenase family protein (plasmid) [Mesorhizobium sp. AR10]|uniref:NAD/NADP octopine/nopaline dehydrogenase family protein n=1 Tax=Mesorhizobium sp. AR10 TaxID=2865839 RepID=UPI00215DFE30|nr:NAD/NADP octopine/nopaline dehydrogenase family protein [Mesorhizobium sp. AR10]UVK35719.1 NAD/NADP octopine/nopaline dehydrogenase family protein [Mesorhizobium sp. AR10]